MKKALSTAIATAVFSFGLAAASEAATLNKTAHLYSGPGYDYAKVLTVPRGAHVGIGGCQQAWCQTSYGAQYGWLHQSFVASAAVSAYGPCRGGPSRCSGNALSNSFLSTMMGSMSRSRRKGGGGGGGTGDRTPDE